MTLVLDGVRPMVRQPRRLVLAAPSTGVVLPEVTPQKFVVGMDGIRRPVAPLPREVVASMQSPLASQADALLPVWSMPSLRLPEIAWRRPAIAFGLVASALLVSTGVTHNLVTPQATAAHSAARTVAGASSGPGSSVKAALAAAPTAQKVGLQQLLNNFVSANPAKFGIVVKDLTTGEMASVNPDTQIASASLYKLFVAQRIYQRIDLGQLDYGSSAGGGTGRTVDQCLTIMINISDNGCGWALGDILGWGGQDQALAIEGYKQTTLATPQKTSAADVAMLFTRLYSGTLVSGNASARFMGLLKDQQVNNRLPQGLPAGTVIAHKTGDLNDVVHDAGIVYGPKTNYLVVVTSGSWNSTGDAPPLFANLSSQLWKYFEQ